MALGPEHTNMIPMISDDGVRLILCWIDKPGFYGVAFA